MSANVQEMFSVKETPWHREGHVLAGAPDLDNAMDLAGHRYRVEVRPTFREVLEEVQIPGSTEFVTRQSFIKNNKAFITYRCDTGVELGAVGQTYQPHQNEDAFRTLEPMLDNGLLTLETGGTLGEGGDAWMMGKFNLEAFPELVQDVFAGELVPYVLIRVNHTGRARNSILLTPIRTVCQNTLMMALRAATDLIGVTHKGDVDAKMIDAAERMFSRITDRYEAVARDFHTLRTTKLTSQQFADLVLAPVAQDPRERKSYNAKSRKAASSVAKYEAKVLEVTRLWDEGRGHTGDHSAWEAWNGLVEALDHNEAGVFPHRGSQRTVALLDGTLAKAKAQVFNNLVALSV